MALAHPFAPESIVLAIGEDGVGIHTVKGKHPRIPSYGNDPHMSALRGSLVYCIEMLRYLSVGIKAVHYIKPLRIFRSLLRQICSASAAQDQHINFILPVLQFVYMVHPCCFCKDLNVFRISSGKHPCQLQIRIMLDSAFHSSSKVAVS